MAWQHFLHGMKSEALNVSEEGPVSKVTLAGISTILLMCICEFRVGREASCVSHLVTV